MKLKRRPQLGLQGTVTDLVEKLCRVSFQHVKCRCVGKVSQGQLGGYQMLADQLAGNIFVGKNILKLRHVKSKNIIR